MTAADRAGWVCDGCDAETTGVCEAADKINPEDCQAREVAADRAGQPTLTEDIEWLISCVLARYSYGDALWAALDPEERNAVAEGHLRRAREMTPMVEAILRDRLPEATTVTEHQFRDLNVWTDDAPRYVHEARKVTRYADHYGPWEEVTDG